MKGRLFLFFTLLIYCINASAQTREGIISSAEYLWAEGREVRPSLADNKAIDNLLTKLSGTDLLPVADGIKGALWKTYRTDIRNNTQVLVTPDGVLRYIAWRDIDRIFSNRWRKVQELVQWAQKSAKENPDVARTYIFWADTYMASLPPADPGLTRQVAAIKASIGAGRTDAVHLRNIESEIGLIQKALRQQKSMIKEPPQQKDVLKQEEIVPDVRDTIQAITSMNLTALMRQVPATPRINAGSVIPKCTTVTPPAAPKKASWNGAILLQADFGRTPSYGIMLLAGYGKIGAYFSARSNFASNAFTYECLQDGSCEYGRFWASGNSRGYRLTFAAGPVYSFHKQFRVYAGAGYGQQNIFWEDSSGEWARVSDLSARGVLLDAGVLWSPGRVTIGVGATLTAFRVPSGVVSVGVNF